MLTNVFFGYLQWNKFKSICDEPKRNNPLGTGSLRDSNKAGKHGESMASAPKLPQNPTHEMQSLIEIRLIEVFRQMSLEDQQRLIELAETVAKQGCE